MASHALSDEEFNKLTERYKKQVQGLVCDKCLSGDNIVAVTRGKPTKEVQLFLARGGQIKLGTCTASHIGYCKTCNHYLTPK